MINVVCIHHMTMRSHSLHHYNLTLHTSKYPLNGANPNQLLFYTLIYIDTLTWPQYGCMKWNELCHATCTNSSPLLDHNDNNDNEQYTFVNWILSDDTAFVHLRHPSKPTCVYLQCTYLYLGNGYMMATSLRNSFEIIRASGIAPASRQTRKELYWYNIKPWSRQRQLKTVLSCFNCWIESKPKGCFNKLDCNEGIHSN